MAFIQVCRVRTVGTRGVESRGRRYNFHCTCTSSRSGSVLTRNLTISVVDVLRVASEALGVLDYWTILGLVREAVGVRVGYSSFVMSWSIIPCELSQTVDPECVSESRM
jgi:hypothetical protein